MLAEYPKLKTMNSLNGGVTVGCFYRDNGCKEVATRDCRGNGPLVNKISIGSLGRTRLETHIESAGVLGRQLPFQFLAILRRPPN